MSGVADSDPVTSSWMNTGMQLTSLQHSLTIRQTASVGRPSLQQLLMQVFHLPVSLSLPLERLCEEVLQSAELFLAWRAHGEGPEAGAELL